MSQREWFYLDAAGQSKGPLTAETLTRMLAKGVGVEPGSLVWREGMEGWLPMSETEAFGAQVALLLTQWFFLDGAGLQQGPCLTRMLLHKFSEGAIDGMTLVFSASLGEWRPLHEVEVLRESLLRLRAEEEEKEAAERRAREIDSTQQVFVVDEEGLQRLVERRNAQSTAKLVEKKTFVANDGLRYAWDEDEQGWVEDDNASEDEEHQEEEDEESDEDPGRTEAHPSTSNAEAAAADQRKKRKRKQRRPRKNQAHWVYITGLPYDVTVEEVKAHFSKVGLIAISATDQIPKIKLYYDEAGDAKGDCTLCYVAEESVKMAIDILSGGYIRPSHQVTVTRADFSQSQPEVSRRYVSAEPQKKKKISHQQVKVAKSAIDQALSWNEEDDAGASKFSFLRIVVLENMFAPQDLDEETFLQGEVISIDAEYIIFPDRVGGGYREGM